MNKILLIFTLFVFPIFLFAQSDLIVEIDSILQPNYTGKNPGLSLGIIKDGRVFYTKGYGLANLEYNINNTDSSVFDIGSIAKQFTAACIWTLVNKGEISLDDDIRKYLPEIPYYGDTIKIRHMLNHTSGLRNYSSILNLAGYDYTEHFFNNQSILELMARQKGLNNIPGEKVLYGNTPYNLLTIIVERISKMKFVDYATENLFIPLGMKNTVYRVDNTSIVKNRSVGYIMEKDSTFSQFSRIEACYGGGSLWSTVEDLTIWSNLFTQPANSYQELVNFLITKDVLKNGEEASYSRGLMRDIYRGYKAIHHSGMTKGYRSQIISIPEIQLSVIILANYDAINPEALSYKIIDLFITATKNVEEEISPYIHKRKDLQKLTGMYQELNSCMKMEVILRNDTLLAKSSFGRNFIALKSKDKKTLNRIDDESVKYVFDKDMGYDLIVYFGATPFYFERINLIDPSHISLDDYTGDYYSKELDVSYKIIKEEDKLYLSYPNNLKITLSSGQQDEFGNGGRTKYTFFRDKNGVVNRMTVGSEGIVKDIEFIK